jgi:bromodomain-containing protein 7/9
MPLADYVRTRVIGPLTGGMHELLYQAGLSLSFGDPGPSIAASSQAHTFLKDDVSDRVKITESIHPALSHLLGVLKQQIDMACLIRRPDEIYESEKAWVGGAGRAARLPGGQTHQERGGLDGDEKEEEDERGEVTLGHEADKLPAVNGHPVGDKLHAAEDDPTNAIAEPLGSAPDAITAEDPRAVAEPNESQEVLQGVLDYVARAILEFDQRIRDGKTLDVKGGGERHGSAFESNVKSEGEPTAQDFEDPMLKMIRLNLLALSKRAPLDKIARLPKELVPVHIRQFVPTT